MELSHVGSFDAPDKLFKMSKFHLLFQLCLGKTFDKISSHYLRTRKNREEIVILQVSLITREHRSELSRALQLWEKINIS